MSKSSTLRRVLLAGAAAVTVAAGVAGCGSSGHRSAGGETTTVPGGPATTNGHHPATGHSTKKIVPTDSGGRPLPNGPDVLSARRNTVETGCSAASGGWRMTGRSTNPSGSKATWKVVVYFTDAHATDLAGGSTTVALPPHGAGTWSVTGTIADPPKVVTCVLVGVGSV